MLSAIGIFFLLLILCCAAGYVMVRYTGTGLRVETRLALLPLGGTVAITLAMQWVHVFVPLRPGAALIGLVPAAAGLALMVWDLLKGRIGKPGRTQLAALGCVLAGALVALLPFTEVARPTSFGIISNDSFYYAAADQVVQDRAYADDHDPTLLVGSTNGIRRYGLNYLSTLAQAITGMRSWEVVHIVGAFGLFLAMCAGFLLTRGLGAGVVAALLAAILVGANHWMFRLYMEAVLGFLYGFAFLMASLWTFTTQWNPEYPIRHRVVLSATMITGLIVCYFDLLPLLLVLTGSLVVTGLFFSKPVPKQLAGFALAALVSLPLLPHALRQFLVVSSVSGPGVHFKSGTPERTFVHVMGMMDLYEYMYWPGRINLLHIAGVLAAMSLVGIAVWRLRSERKILWFAGSVIAPLMLLFVHVFRQGREYHAHRVLTLIEVLSMAAMAAVLSQTVRRAPELRRVVIGLAVVALIAAAQPVTYLLGLFERQNLVVSAAEKQVGDEWMKALPADAVVFLDLTPDSPVFNAHFLYFETAHALNDERRVLFPAVNASYILTAQPFPALDLSRVSHVLRLRNRPSLIEGQLREIASNERYQLFEVPRGGVVHFAGSNWYGLEVTPGIHARWVQQDAQTRVCSRVPTEVVAHAQTIANPAIGALTVSAIVNGKPAAEAAVPGPLNVRLPLPAGCSVITWHSSEPPRVPGNGDGRLLSVQIQNLKLEPAL